MWALSYVTGAGVAVAGDRHPLPDRCPRDLLGVQLLPTTEQPWWLVGTLIPIGAASLSRLPGSLTRRQTGSSPAGSRGGPDRGRSFGGPSASAGSAPAA